MLEIRHAVAILLSIGLVVVSWCGWFPSPVTETLGFVTGAWCVYLVVVQHIATFPLGIANNVFFLVLFYEARLFGDAGLQVVYMALAVHGWYWWLHGGENRGRRRVSRVTLRHAAVLAGLVAVGTWALKAVLDVVSGSAPLLDAFTTTLSLAAQYLLNWKFIENWYVWILADVIYIYLYWVRGLHLTAVLYLVFIGLCAAGLAEWRRSLLEPEAPAPAAA
jgi:nicotinamide mononucleotide transporter